MRLQVIPLPTSARLSNKRLRRQVREGKVSPEQARQIRGRFEVSCGRRISEYNYSTLHTWNYVLRTKQPAPDPWCYSGVNNVMELYHGTSMESAIHALFNGFKPGTEGMFGPGMYFGQKHKAANYTKYNYRFMVSALMKCRVNVGLQLHTVTAEDLSHCRSLGYDSVHGIAGVTESWTPAAKLLNDEWCVYDNRQIVVDSIEFSIGPSAPEKVRQDFRNLGRVLG